MTKQEQQEFRRPCRTEGCGQIIKWHNIEGKRPGVGYFVNDDGPHKDSRHLCPHWVDRRDPKFNHNKTNTENEIISKLSELEAKIDNYHRDLSAQISATQRQLVKQQTRYAVIQ